MKENFRVIRKFPHKNINRSSVLESHGPDGKIRGTMHQLIDRYVSLGREALRDGDGVIAENFFQHADHYRRLLSACVKRPSDNTASPAFQHSVESQEEDGLESDLSFIPMTEGKKDDDTE